MTTTRRLPLLLAAALLTAGCFTWVGADGRAADPRDLMRCEEHGAALNPPSGRHGLGVNAGSDAFAAADTNRCMEALGYRLKARWE